MNLLLHTCCGVCAASVLERLVPQAKEITVYYYNPNIEPEEEYYRRMAEVKKLADIFSVNVFVEEYDHQAWRTAMTGHEKAPEGGSRCQKCFRYRLQRAYQKTLALGFDRFTTTLTVSPHKNAAVINEIGREIGGELYYAADFKENNGYQRSVELAKQHDMYRQKYCGCLFVRKN
jgi:predicted adenine nucleotide alpha hydrolase (AANH) superfamily ATPase